MPWMTGGVLLFWVSGSYVINAFLSVYARRGKPNCNTSMKGFWEANLEGKLCCATYLELLI